MPSYSELILIVRVRERYSGFCLTIMININIFEMHIDHACAFQVQYRSATVVS